MNNIESRLNSIEDIITKPNFKENKGLGNEVGYYIFDYDPKDEIYVRNHVDYLVNKFSKFNHNISIVKFDLYELMIEEINKKGYMDKNFEFEKKKGSNFVFNAISKMLKLTDKNNVLINYIVEKTPDNSVIFITGIGKCFPIIRAHNILNNLHQVLDKVPVILFFPGEYSGLNLELFGLVDDRNYYRAFKLV